MTQNQPKPPDLHDQSSPGRDKINNPDNRNRSRSKSRSRLFYRPKNNGNPSLADNRKLIEDANNNDVDDRIKDGGRLYASILKRRTHATSQIDAETLSHPLFILLHVTLLLRF